MPDTLSFRVDQGDIGGRLDRALMRHAHEISGLSRTRVQRWIAEGHVTMNTAPARRPGVTVPPGARISFTLPSSARRRQRLGPEPGALDIAFEDDHLLVLNKPAGLVVHPSYRNATGTLLNRVLWHVRHRRTPVSPGLVSRLDKGTSGLVVVALSSVAHARVQRAAARGLVRKEYLALVAGRPNPPAGRVILGLRRDGSDRRRVIVAGDGVPCETHYETLALGGTAALLRIVPVTGRTHQIRVHLAASGWPILGDGTYGAPLEGLTRPALHAWRVALPHPASRDELAFEAPLPADLQKAMAALGLALRRRA